MSLRLLERQIHKAILSSDVWHRVFHTESFALRPYLSYCLWSCKHLQPRSYIRFRCGLHSQERLIALGYSTDLFQSTREPSAITIDQMSAISIGCWTCRVRHKKCDITIPFCRECSDRNVHCHGYGPKPTWMDGASEEKKERVRIKTAINQHVRRVRKMQNRTKRALLPQADKETQPHTNSGINASTAFDTEEDSNILPSASLELLDRPSSQDGIFDLQAASLLMHYFDQVFAWQFPYFRSTSPLGNRGWLLYLLMKRGPLYHAVLSLSSLHQSAILGSEEEYQQRERVLEHHSRALREFCKFMCEERGKLLDNNARLAEFLACSLILISCEVGRGHLSTYLTSD